MKRALQLLTITLAFCAVAAWAEDMVIQKVEVLGPSGNINGRLVMLGDRMVFVQENNPDVAFVIPKGDIRAARWGEGRLTIDLSKPYIENRSNFVVVMRDPSYAGRMVTWMGVPVEGISNEATRVAGASPTVEVTDVAFDITSGDDKGKLTLTSNDVRFDSRGGKTHRWSYSDIREVKRSGDHEIKVKVADGKDFDFKFKNPVLLNTAYDLLSGRVRLDRR